MEARDSGSKIRPLPIDDIDGDAPQHRQLEPPRRWLPLAVIVMGAIAFGVIARGLAPSEPAEVAASETTAAALSEEPIPTTTTKAPPPPLSRMLPFAVDGLQLVQIEGSAAIGTWEVDAPLPGFGANIGQAESAAYNTDGSYLAVHSRVKDGSITITDGEGYYPIYLQGDIWAGSWHPTDPDLYAWTQQLGSADRSSSVLMVADLSGRTEAGLEPLVELPLAGGPHVLLDWGDWGFITANWSGDTGPVVTALDADGLNPLALEGEFFGATPGGELLMARLGDSGYMPYLVEADRTQTELVGLDIGAADFRMTSDGAWVIAVTQQADGHTSILARTVRSRSTRLTSINEAATIVNLSTDNRYIVLQGSLSGDLVFKDWSTGAEHRVPIDNATVAAVYLSRPSFAEQQLDCPAAPAECHQDPATDSSP